jgi:hypothetical protein
MKYVMSWTARPGGSGAEIEKAERRSLDVFSKWSPSPDVTFHQFVQRVDGEGGFAVVETDNPAGMLSDCAKFGPWFSFQVFPVLDMMDSIPVINEALEFRESIG